MRWAQPSGALSGTAPRPPRRTVADRNPDRHPLLHAVAVSVVHPTPPLGSRRPRPRPPPALPVRHKRGEGTSRAPEPAFRHPAPPSARAARPLVGPARERGLGSARGGPRRHLLCLGRQPRQRGVVHHIVNRQQAQQHHRRRLSAMAHVLHPAPGCSRQGMLRHSRSGTRGRADTPPLVTIGVPLEEPDHDPYRVVRDQLGRNLRQEREAIQSDQDQGATSSPSARAPSRTSSLRCAIPRVAAGSVR